ncbi:restriction endonuclease subunit S [Leptolyngbyaceae cyanobacterium CCMR0082]|uniref:Restriction endonuclease subunit S n=1 Tax=Adonisia turfae CCMR0082 TaxID=2304604 RepID=A0A6M0RZZ5_9CYAN|nr:restriction endonuclease subunit S [Adonisia turfae]NEZ61777.1 restriction endonuclease subunit S [Adonisia turfae CCMR0082]
MITFSPYEHYQDSQISWLGKVPKHWNFKKAKYLFRKSKIPVRKQDGVVTAYRDGEVTLRTNRRAEGYTVAILEQGYQGVRKGQLVINSMDAFAGAIGVSDSDGKCSPEYVVCDPVHSDEVEPRYYALLIREMALRNYIQVICPAVRQRALRIRYNSLAPLFFPLPPCEEQRRIVEFLDRKTAEIDDEIATKQRLIELLQEQKAILINQAVTKGLDPNVSMRDSGVSWINDIPEKWTVLPLTKYVKSVVDYRGKTPTKVDSGVFLVTAKNIKNGSIDYEVSKEYVPENKYAEIMSRGSPKKNDLLFTTEAPLGGVALVDREDIALAQRIIKFRLDEQYLDARFTRYSMLSFYFQSFLSTEATGSTAQGIKASKLHKLKIIAPPIEEQEEIVEFIDQGLAQINEIYERQQEIIDELINFRQILIANSVTGKIKF